jgi:hypothetical protein
MLLAVHILSAISCVLYNSLIVFRPSKRGLHIAYGLIGSTLLSGGLLIRSTDAPLKSVCLSGVAYIMFATTTVSISRYRLKKSLEI